MSALDQLLSPVNQWLDTLQPREKNMVIAGSISLLVILFYLIIWEPITSHYEEQQQSLEYQRQQYAWMKNASAEIVSLKAAGGSLAARSRNQSISSLADRSAQVTGVKPFINKIEQSNSGVKVVLASANFDLIINWLSDLENKYGVMCTNIKVDRSKESGAVDVNVTLERPE